MRFAAAAVILDLDGTLLDTVGDLAAAVNGMLGALGREALPPDEVARYVGKGAATLVHRALTRAPDGRADAPLFERAHALFLERYRIENGVRARAYPGVVAALERMSAQRLRLAVVTNKPAAFTLPLLERTGLARFFELVVSGDTLARMKPDPQPMLHVAAAFGVAPAAIVAIGDSANDALAARAAGMPVIAVSYGYSEGTPASALPVDAIVDSLPAAADLIDCA